MKNDGSMLKSGDLLSKISSGPGVGLGQPGNGLGTVDLEAVKISNQYEEEEGSSDFNSEEGSESVSETMT